MRVTTNITEAMADFHDLARAAESTVRTSVREAMRVAVDDFYRNSPVLTANYRSNLSLLMGGKRTGGYVAKRWRKAGAYSSVAATRRRTILAAVKQWQPGQPVEFENLADHAGILEYGGPSMAARAPMRILGDTIISELEKTDFGAGLEREWNPRSAGARPR